MRTKRKLNLKASFAGFNTSKRADRTTVDTFIYSYLKAFPRQRLQVEQEVGELEDWLIKILSKPTPITKTKIAPNQPKLLAKLPEPREWVHPRLYIPDKPNPRSKYLRQAANIARDMRDRLEAEGATD